MVSAFCTQTRIRIILAPLSLNSSLVMYGVVCFSLLHYFVIDCFMFHNVIMYIIYIWLWFEQQQLWICSVIMPPPPPLPGYKDFRFRVVKPTVYRRCFYEITDEDRLVNAFRLPRNFDRLCEPYFKYFFFIHIFVIVRLNYKAVMIFSNIVNWS